MRAGHMIPDPDTITPNAPPEAPPTVYPQEQPEALPDCDPLSPDRYEPDPAPQECPGYSDDGDASRSGRRLERRF